VPHHELESVGNGLTGSSIAVLSLFVARPLGRSWHPFVLAVPHSCHNGKNFGGSGRTDWYQKNRSDLPVCVSALVSGSGLIEFPS